MMGIAVAWIRIWGAAMRESAKSKRQKSDGGVLSHYSAPAFHFLPPLDLDQWRRLAGVLPESRHVR
jgi:hypothetical protein